MSHDSLHNEKRDFIERNHPSLADTIQNNKMAKAGRKKEKKKTSKVFFDSFSTLEDIEDSMRLHKVGGPLFTKDEYEALTRALFDPHQAFDDFQRTLPCRVRHTLSFFWEEEPQHREITRSPRQFKNYIICRNSLGYDLSKLTFLKNHYEEARRRTPEEGWNVVTERNLEQFRSLPAYYCSLYFLLDLHKVAIIVKDNSYQTAEEEIMRKCFQLPNCKQHACCRRANKIMSGKRFEDCQIMLNCCDSQDCPSFIKYRETLQTDGYEVKSEVFFR